MTYCVNCKQKCRSGGVDILTCLNYLLFSTFNTTHTLYAYFKLNMNVEWGERVVLQLNKINSASSVMFLH